MTANGKQNTGFKACTGCNDTNHSTCTKTDPEILADINKVRAENGQPPLDPKANIQDRLEFAQVKRNLLQARFGAAAGQTGMPRAGVKFTRKPAAKQPDIAKPAQVHQPMAMADPVALHTTVPDWLEQIMALWSGRFHWFADTEEDIHKRGITTDYLDAAGRSTTEKSQARAVRVTLPDQTILVDSGTKLTLHSEVTEQAIRHMIRHAAETWGGRCAINTTTSDDHKILLWKEAQRQGVTIVDYVPPQHIMQAFMTERVLRNATASALPQASTRRSLRPKFAKMMPPLWRAGRARDPSQTAAALS